MICFPNCKINLGLSIFNKRPDGYHNLETILYPVGLHDLLEIIVAPDGQFSFLTTGIKIHGDQEDNLVFKAYRLMQNKFHLPPVRIHLHKVIPIGAGLGGGSSDAAFAIKTLNQLFNLCLSVSAMQDFARELGSDCAFFIDNKPVFAKEKGDQFEPIDLNLEKYYFTIVKPAIHIHTAEAYSWVTPSYAKTMLQEIIVQPMNHWRYRLTNDFEDEVFDIYPEIKQIKDLLYQMGAIYAAMSGSGSAVFGIFQNPVEPKGQFQSHYYWSGKGL